MADVSVNKDTDLPLMANVDCIRVRHYMMQLLFDFNEEIVFGEAIIFCQDLEEIEDDTNERTNFELLLDQRHIEFTEVSELKDFTSEFELILSSFESRKDLNLMKSCFQKTTSPLMFKTDDWCLRIWKEGIFNAKDFPKVIKIGWKTQREAKSLMWRLDQDGEKCVFTAAAAVNNRSLFPCQEPPTAMASWQCSIQATKPDVSILCTGDQNAQISKKDHYFYTQMILPMSTFAVAIGSWKSINLAQNSVLFDRKSSNHSMQTCKNLHEYYPCHVSRGDLGPSIPCRFFGPASILNKASELWSLYVPACLESAYELFGPHPFDKLDICIIPRCYSGLGLASPNLMFISHTLIRATDGGMMIKIAHEIAHNWFGLLIGTKDWTEEWLTEVSTI